MPPPHLHGLTEPARGPGGDLEARSEWTCDLLSHKGSLQPRGQLVHSSDSLGRGAAPPLQRTLTATLTVDPTPVDLHHPGIRSRISSGLGTQQLVFIQQNPRSLPREPSLLEAPSVSTVRLSFSGWGVRGRAPHWFCAPYSLQPSWASLQLCLRQPGITARSPWEGQIPSLAQSGSRKQGPWEAGLGGELVPGKPFGRLPGEAGVGFSGACNPSPTSSGEQKAVWGLLGRRESF